MKIEFDTNEYLKKIAKSDTYFHTFLNKESIAAGILYLGPGDEDTQEPHESDEVYYVVKGDGFLTINGKDNVISEGMSYYVEKRFNTNFMETKKILL